MKKLFFSVFVTLLFTLSSFAQNEGINFQGVARNAAGEVLVSQKINLRLSILLGSETGVVAYMETRQATTNPQGVFAVVVGDALALTKSTNFSSINWTPAPKFIKVEMDPNAGTNYLVMGTSRLQAVPFAFYANGVDAGNVKGVLPISSGGTGATSITDLKTSLGLDQVNNTAFDTKVDKVAGKGLSTNDYTTAEKTKLAAISGTNTGDQDLSSFATTAQLATKATASDVTNSLATKVDKVTGKELSTNDYTTAEKTKLAAITGTNTGDQDLSSYATIAMVNSIDVTSSLASGLATKVDKVTGKALSTNDYTTAEKTKLAAITGTNTGDQDLSGYATTAQLATKANASEVTTSLAAKAIASDVTTSLATKVDKVTGKELSTNDYTTAEKTKLAAITGTNTGDQVNITGNAGTATKLQNARTINGIAFDGSANITLPAAAAGIPYTGATQAVDLGAYDLKVNGLTVGRGKENIVSNTAIGKDALLSNNTFGQNNTAIGNLALSSNIFGAQNTAIGSGSLNSNTNGVQNTAVGTLSLEKSVGVSYNTAVGSEALRYTVGGESNTATGASALKANISGAYNSAFGRNALAASTASSMNAAFGAEALAANLANGNSAYGAYALQINTTGYGNTAMGIGAMKFHTTGNDNVAIGVNAGLFASNQTTGSNNTAIGSFAEYGAANLSNATVIGSYAKVAASNTIQLGNTDVTNVNTSGSVTANGVKIGRGAGNVSTNTAAGSNALGSNTSGGNNTAVGNGALQTNATGTGNTAIGGSALSASTGVDNTALGYNALLGNTTGSNNTALGYAADVSANNLTNATAIGSGATVSASNSIRLGNAAVTVIGGQVAWTAASDSRIKKNIVNSTYGLATVLKLRPVEYNLTSNDLKQVGFIAQEVQKLVPEVVTGKEGDLSKGEILGITYSNLVPVLTKAIQEQQKQIEDQNAKIAAQQKQIEELIKLVKGQ